MFSAIKDSIKSGKYESNTWQAFEDHPQLIEQHFADHEYMKLARIAKHVPSVKARLLEIISNYNMNKDLSNSDDTSGTNDTAIPNSLFSNSNHTLQDIPIRAVVVLIVAALRYEKILPQEVWDQYGEQTVEWIAREINSVEKDSCGDVCDWMDLLPLDKRKYLYR